MAIVMTQEQVTYSSPNFCGTQLVSPGFRGSATEAVSGGTE